MDHDGRGLKNQMKQADKAGARHVLIIGDQEIAKGVGMLRNMANQEQREIPLDDAGLDVLVQSVLQNTKEQG
jgi:histidyl-tRNA synthetase